MADRKGLNTVKSGAASEADVRSPLAPRIASQAGVPKKHAHPRAASFVHHAVLAHGAQLVCQGDLLRFCLDNADVVAGLALQPAFTSGRFDAERALPMSSGDVIFQLAEQSDGLIEPRDV